MSDKTVHVQITLTLPEAAARQLFAEIRDHRDRDVTDGHRDSGLVMLPAEAIAVVGMRVADTCAGCRAAGTGADRLDYFHDRDCPLFSAFYDAPDEELAGMVPPPMTGGGDRG